VRREAAKLRLYEWRRSPKLVTEARRVFELESFRIMLDVLKNENPANLVLPLGSTPADRSAIQCRAEGYAMALANLEAMCNPAETMEPLEATFEPEQTQSTDKE